MKFDQKSIQEFFTEHVEKIVFGAVILCFLVFAYQSLMLKGYSERPSNLQTAVDKAKEHILEGRAEKLAYLDFAKIVQQSRDWVDYKKSATTVAWLRPPRITATTRDMPKVLELVDLRGEAGRGAVDMVAASGGNGGGGNAGGGNSNAARNAAAMRMLGVRAGGGANHPAADHPVHAAHNPNAQGKRWISLVGLVPLKLQKEEYKRLFQGATLQDPQRDVPVYSGFYVERAEVDPKAADGGTGEIKWSTVYSQNTMFGDAKTWSAAADVVDAKYVHPNLCSKLPSLNDRTWGPEVAHGPEIPVAGEEQPADDTAKPADGAAEPAADDTANADTPAPAPEAAAPTPPAGGGMRGMLLGQMAAGHAHAASGPNAAETSNEDYLLFRFFDFDVEPGKQYCYRVFLVLRNPNRGLETKYLSKSEYATPISVGVKKETKGAAGKIVKVDIDEEFGQWSKPSPLIAVPEDIELLAGPVVAKPSQELTGTIRVTRWIEKLGVTAVGNFSVVRGKIADFTGCALRTQSGESEGSQKVNYLTGQIVVDLAGGEKIGIKDKTLLRPGEILVMDKAGNLVMHDELRDKAALAREAKPSASDESGGSDEAPERPAVAHPTPARPTNPALVPHPKPLKKRSEFDEPGDSEDTSPVKKKVAKSLRPVGG